MYTNRLILSFLRLIFAAEKTFTVISLVLFLETLTHILSGSLLKLCYYSIYIISFLFICLRWRNFLYRLTKANLFILALLGVVILSIIWSDFPAWTQAQVREFIGTSIFAAYFSTRYKLKEQMQLLLWALAIAAVSSLFYAVAIPSYGIMHTKALAGTWCGIFKHKNLLGRMMALGGLLFFLLQQSGFKPRWLPLTMLGISIILIQQSQSGGGKVIFATLMLLAPLYRALRFRYNFLTYLLIVSILAGGVASVWFADNVGNFVYALGKDETLSGRVPLWRMLITLIGERPWLGYGYQAFWRGWKGASAYVFRYAGWFPPNAHNGFLDLLLQTGYLGFIVFVMGFIINVKRAIICVRTTKTVEGLCPLLFLTFVFLGNLSESRILANNTIFWIFMVTTSFLHPTQRDTAI